MTYVEIQKEYDFTTEFPTWIIAYCVDTDSWFCTNQRFFYYEYPEDWKKIVERAMNTDYSWGNSAKQYEAMYDELTK